jgi:hypothetical protein
VQLSSCAGAFLTLSIARGNEDLHGDQAVFGRIYDTGQAIALVSLSV